MACQRCKLRRAAKAAGIDAARVYKVSDGCFKIRPAGDSITANAMKALTGVDESKPTKAAKPPKAPKVAKAKPAAPSTKGGTKSAKLIEMITCGATASELQKALGWLPHTTRGAISRLGKDWGYNITRTKVGTADEGFESHYKIAS